MNRFVDWARMGLFLVAWAPALHAEMPNFALPATGNFAVPLHSLKGLRFRNTIHQQFDFSCGSAALATLLTHHYGHRVSEQDVFKEMYQRGNQAKIAKEGFSLLDIKNYLAERGFEADGYVAELDQLVEAKVPAIALIQENGYHHFVVIKGVRNGRVLLGDPSAGTRAVPHARFQQMWVNKILFVIRNRLELARFNHEADWRSAPSAPINNALYRGGLNGLLPKRSPGDF